MFDAHITYGWTKGSFEKGCVSGVLRLFHCRRDSFVKCLKLNRQNDANTHLNSLSRIFIQGDEFVASVGCVCVCLREI